MPCPDGTLRNMLVFLSGVSRLCDPEGEGPATGLCLSLGLCPETGSDRLDGKTCHSHTKASGRLGAFPEHSLGRTQGVAESGPAWALGGLSHLLPGAVLGSRLCLPACGRSIPGAALDVPCLRLTIVAWAGLAFLRRLLSSW